jgi:hypothetical protein
MVRGYAFLLRLNQKRNTWLAAVHPYSRRGICWGIAHVMHNFPKSCAERAQNAEQRNKWILKVRLPERIEHVSAFTRPSQHCEISQKSIRDWCSEIFWGISLNLATECPCHSI